MKYFITTVVIFVSAITFAQEPRQEIHCKHFFYGYPFGAQQSNDLIIRDIYALSNNDETKFADWVAYKLTMHEVDGELTIERAWKSDPWLDENETLETSSDDYERANKKLKTDRGHQAPLASFKGSRYASQTNYLSNITPQKAALNQGPWKKLEDKVRDIVFHCNEVYVMTGPLFEREMNTLPESDEPHKVPSGYWKIICTEVSDAINIAGFIFDQETPRRDKVIDHLETIDEIEQRSGLDFLWLLEDNKEHPLEANKNLEFAIAYFAD